MTLYLDPHHHHHHQTYNITLLKRLAITTENCQGVLSLAFINMYLFLKCRKLLSAKSEVQIHETIYFSHAMYFLSCHSQRCLQG